MIDYKALGKRLKKHRNEKKYTQEEFAQLINISTSFYGNIERGVGVPSLETLVDIANVLEVGLDYLLYESMAVKLVASTRAEERHVRSFLREPVTEMEVQQQ